MPILFANITDITSIPSIAPPYLIVIPLPTPEIKPPNKAQSNKSVPAKGDAKETSIGNTSVISHAPKEYTAIVYKEYRVNNPPCFLYPKTKSGILSNNKNTDNEHQSGVICDNSIDVPEIPLSYSFTGERKTVTPKAFTNPAIVSIIIFLNLKLHIITFPFH